MAASRASQVSVGEVPTLIAAGSSDATLGEIDQLSFAIKNVTATATVYLDTTTRDAVSALTTSDGWPWAATDGMLFIDLEPGERLYGVVASSAQALATLPQGR